MAERSHLLVIGRSLLLYMLSFLLFLEWLLPLPYVTDIGFIPLFMLTTMLFFLITFLQWPFLLSFVVKIVTILFGIHLMFFETSFFQLDWLLQYGHDLLENVIYLFTGRLLLLSDMFRSTLFFILLAIMSYLLYYWSVVAKRLLFFVIFTALFVTIIDTFTDYDASFAIIRIFIISFLLIGLVTMYRVMERNRLVVRSFLFPLKLVSALTFTIICATMFGFLAPKLEPQWADPVPYMKSLFGFGKSSSYQKIGYSENDERLGGGFQDDQTVAFHAIADKPTYWRGDAKEIYTGHGWVASNEQYFVIGIAPTLFEEDVNAERQIAEVFLHENSRFNHLFYVGQIMRLMKPTGMMIDLMTNVSSGKIYTYKEAKNASFEHYEFEYLAPKFPVEQLKMVKTHRSVHSAYLQLPDSLPERVRELAADIVKDESNHYDKAKAIERFLRFSDLRYETEDVAIPDEGVDYVDQFLFETKRGYCDNFSTAMVVMLRAVDIPARWVKGFTQGTEIDKLEDGRSVYEVTNGNAHSWVEVFFPNYGWVPFEPTPSFFSPFQFDFGEEDESIDDIEQEEEREEQQVEKQAQDNQKNKGTGDVSSMHMIVISAVLLVVLIGSFIAYKARIKLFARYYIRRYYSRDDERTLEISFMKLLLLLEKRGHRRLEQETLREYAKRIDDMYESDEMSELTMSYEQVMYGNKNARQIWEEKRHVWKTFVERVAT